MSRPRWRASISKLKASLDAAGRGGRPLRIVVLGVGNEINGDDGAGLLALRVLKRTGALADNVLLLETGPAPENFTGPVARFQPDWVLAVDAARLGQPAGAIQLIPQDEVEGASAATHGLPLSVTGGYLRAETGCTFSIVGIQVQQTGFGQPISPPVRRAAIRVGKYLAEVLR